MKIKNFYFTNNRKTFALKSADFRQTFENLKQQK
jgi:hypothetical protein